MDDPISSPETSLKDGNEIEMKDDDLWNDCEEEGDMANSSELKSGVWVKQEREESADESESEEEEELEPPAAVWLQHREGNTGEEENAERHMHTLSGVTKEDILSKLIDGSYILLEKTNIRSSLCWETFKVVVERNTKIPVGYVQCQREGCKALLIYKGSTAGMKKHRCRDSKYSSGYDVSTADKVMIRKKCVLMCASEFQPINIVSGEGFVNLSQELINTGAKCGQVSAQDVLPSLRLLTQHIKNVADEIRVEIIPKVKEAIGKGQCAMTCDLWTDNYQKTHYLMMTSTHMEDVDERWELKNNMLISINFPEVTKTGGHILEEIYKQMAELHITRAELKKIYFVIDEEPNIKKILSNHKCLPCMMQCLNATLEYTLNETFLRDELPDVHYSIQVARNIERFMKLSGLVKKLKKPLLPEVETRWNGIYTLLNSFNLQKEQIENILKKADKQEDIEPYCSEITGKVIDFLELFKEATNDLECETEPTLPFVVPWVFKLLDSCQIEDGDATLKKLKDRAGKFLKEKVLNELVDIHYVATFLHPSFKELSALSEAKREIVMDTVRQMLNGVEVTNMDENLLPSRAKKFRNWISASKPQDELKRYINMDHPSECKDLLAWWATHSSSLPKLSKLAREVLCIPASSAAGKRNLTKAGVVISQGKSYIDPDSLNDFLLIHNNKKNLSI